MRTYAVQSVRYSGYITYSFNESGVLTGFDASCAEIENERLFQIVSYLPPSLDKLKEMVEIAKKQKTLVNFYEIRKDISFDSFWAQYPRKVGKVEAQKQFSKLKDAEATRAIEYIKTYRKNADKDKVSYLYPATYLNQKRWEDEK